MDGSVDDNHSGFTGEGFVNTDNAKGKSVNWSVTVPAEANYILEWRYANGGGSDRPGAVQINGKTVDNVDFSGTGSWSSWTDDMVNISLDEGRNNIRLVATGNSGLPNIDSLFLVGNDIRPASCGGNNNGSSSSSSSSSSSTGSSSSSSSSSSGGSSQGSPDSSMGGFAAVSKYGVKTTTGGAGGRTVTVSNFGDLKAHAESSERVIIQVSGTVSAPGEHGLIKVRSNKTIIGRGGNAKLNRVTLSVNGFDRAGETCDADDRDTFTPASNVIIRNLEFTGLADFPDKSNVDPDAIRVECYSHHVWIDHNTFRRSADGSTDIKRGADMVTISYNHYVNTGKTALVGHSDNNGSQDKGFLNVTFHHNFFDRTETRTPRVRFGYAHVYNNYYDISNHVFRISSDGQIYAEGNYVASTEGKILRDTENDGNLTWTTSNIWDKSAYGDIGTKKLDADQSVGKPPYSYSADSASSSPPSAGSGKL